MDMVFVISMVVLVGIDVYDVKFITMEFQIILFIYFKNKNLILCNQYMLQYILRSEYFSFLITNPLQ